MTVRYIIDASVAVKWFYEESFRLEARRYFASSASLIAPDIIQQEFANAIVKKIRYQDVNPENGWQSYQSLFQSDTLELISVATLMDRAFTMAVSMGMLFMTVFISSPPNAYKSVAVTADRKFFDRVSLNKEFSIYIRWVEDPPE